MAGLEAPGARKAGARWPGSRAATALALALLTLAIFLPVAGHQFVAYDDAQYVSGNPIVLDGLRPAGVLRAFTSFHAANWHPLTWLSHMLDVELFGLDPRGHHLSSLALHAANAALLFLLLAGLTGAHGAAALAAALFAAHPLHVESVAWVSERKDVLSTFFWLLAFGAYLRQARRPSRGRAAATAALFALALLAKPMPVSFPFALLLLDFWPLGRLRFDDRRGAPALASLPRLLLEKLPLFLLAAASAAVTLVAQSPPPARPLADRAANVLLSYAAYLGKIAWPVDLAFLYPLREGWSAAAVAGAAALLAAITAAALVAARRQPWLAVGWLWFLGTLVPVIGLVQVGLQAMADRYTYVPAVGIFIAFAFGLAAASRRGRARVPAAVAAAALVLALAALARMQTGFWRDSETLFRRAVACAPANYMALDNLGIELAGQGRDREAEQYFRESLRHARREWPSWFFIGGIQARRGDFAGALATYRRAVEIFPESAELHNALGATLAQAGRADEACPHFAEALRLKPDFAEAHYNAGRCHERRGDAPAAAASYRAALGHDPSLAAARERLAALAQGGGGREGTR